MAWRMTEKEPLIRACEATTAVQVAMTSIGQKKGSGTVDQKMVSRLSGLAITCAPCNKMAGKQGEERGRGAVTKHVDQQL